MPSVTIEINTTNTSAGTVAVWSTPLAIRGGVSFNLSVWGTFVASLTLQRTFDGGTTWLSVNSYSTPTEDMGTNVENCLYRIGVDAGNYTSGTAYARVGAE